MFQTPNQRETDWTLRKDLHHLQTSSLLTDHTITETINEIHFTSLTFYLFSLKFDSNIFKVTNLQQTGTDGVQSEVDLQGALFSAHQERAHVGVTSRRHVSVAVGDDVHDVSGRAILFAANKARKVILDVFVVEAQRTAAPLVLRHRPVDVSYADPVLVLVFSYAPLWMVASRLPVTQIRFDGFDVEDFRFSSLTVRARSLSLAAPRLHVHVTADGSTDGGVQISNCNESTTGELHLHQHNSDVTCQIHLLLGFTHDHCCYHGNTVTHLLASCLVLIHPVFFCRLFLCFLSLVRINKVWRTLSEVTWLSRPLPVPHVLSRNECLRLISQSKLITVWVCLF